MGVALSLVFRTPDFGQAAVGRQTIEQMAIRGPAAVKVAAQRHLEQHPNDVAAMFELAEANRGLSDTDGEADTLRRVHEVGNDADRNRAWTRLAEIDRLSVLPINDRRRLAERLTEDSPELAERVARSVVDDADDALLPDALFSLASLIRESNPAESQGLLDRLAAEHPLHPAVDIARKRGWLA